MSHEPRRLRTPEERVGCLPNASLPPPGAASALLDDELLFRALRDREETAFARVLDLCYTPMMRVAQSHVRDRAAAEEVVQDTWLAALEGIGRFEGRSSVRTWLFRVLRNIARARGRRDDRMTSLTALTPAGAGTEDADPYAAVVDARTASAGHGHAALWTRGEDPEADLLRGEVVRRLEAALSLLPARQREVIVLRDIEGWSAEEVCNTLGLSDTNQRVLLHRARERVRGALMPLIADTELCPNEDANDVH